MEGWLGRAMFNIRKYGLLSGNTPKTSRWLYACLLNCLMMLFISMMLKNTQLMTMVMPIE
jgi:hypothetical protein